MGHAAALLLLAFASAAWAQETGTIRGTVTFGEGKQALHDAHVLLLPSGKVVISESDGTFEFRGVPVGPHSLIARMRAMGDDRKSVTVSAGQTVSVDFNLTLQALRQEVTVTATGSEVSVDDTFQTITSRDSYELAIRSEGSSIGDLLDKETGIAKRSFGPGTTRPVIRGFDGDRVLMLQDGVRTGTLSYQSGDHGEPIDVNTVERVEVVRGPATLLYGSNAIGGVVNVISNEHILHEQPHDGLTGRVTALAGSANGQAQGTGNFSYGQKNWLIAGGGGGLRSGDYKAAVIGSIQNSGTEMKNGYGSIGRFGERASFNLNFTTAQGRYGIPVNSLEEHDDEAEEGHGHGRTQLDWRKYNVRFNGAIKKLGGFLEEFQYYGNYTFWNHNEIDVEDADIMGGRPTVTESIGTQFFNKQWTYQGVFKQRKKGRLDGSFGFWGVNRGYEARGAEALSPPVSKNSFAAFALEEFDLERVKLQFGGRIESNQYQPSATYESRRFTGASGSMAAIVPLWRGGSLVGNYMHSYRAPALEELYNNGPHPGNQVFEIGDPNLTHERGDGVEISLRHRSSRVRLEANVYRNHMHDFVYLRPAGYVEEGLRVADYAQADARFLGAEARAEFLLLPSLWLLTGFDAVDANLTVTRDNLPRIPPVRGRVGFDWRRGRLSLRPEMALSNRQWQVSSFETPTAGYAVFGLTGSYTIARAHTMHIFSASLFNLGDRLYRNHLSFIKEYAPEIGRGARIGYTFQWY